MSHYLLLHGAWHSSNTWRKLTPLLEARGHTVSAPNLPGHPSSSALKKISFQRYVDCVIAEIERINTPVQLVGHSMSGILLGAVGERLPKKIERLIYVAAFAPSNGESMLDDAQRLSHNSLLTEISVEPSANAFILAKSDRTKALLYSMCSPEDAEAETAALCIQPLRPIATPIETTPDNFGKINKLYVACLQDLATPFVDQQRMAKRLPRCRIVEVDADHTPHLSCPEALAEAILA